MNFFKKFGELQLLMLQHNAGLTASHPYASGPINWPFLVSGISFWTQNEGQKQIYLIGNLVGWLASTFGVAIFIGILGADLLARRRGIEPIPTGKSACVYLALGRCADHCRRRQRCGTGCGTRRASSCSCGRCTTCRSS